MKVNKLIERLQHLANQGYGEDEVMIWNQIGEDRFLTTVEDFKTAETPIEDQDGTVVVLLP